MQCKHCGRELSPEQTFCTYCGNAVQDSAQPQNPAPQDGAHAVSFGRTDGPGQEGQQPAAPYQTQNIPPVYQNQDGQQPGYSQQPQVPPQMPQQGYPQAPEFTPQGQAPQAPYYGNQQVQTGYQQFSPEPEKKKSNLKLVLIIAFSALAVLVFTIVFIMLSSKNSARKEAVAAQIAKLDASLSTAEDYLKELDGFFVGKDKSYIIEGLEAYDFSHIVVGVDSLQTEADGEYASDVEYDFEKLETTVQSCRDKVAELEQKIDLVFYVNYMFEEDAIKGDAVNMSVSIYRYLDQVDIDDASKAYDRVDNKDSEFMNAADALIQDSKVQLTNLEAAAELIDDLYFEFDSSKITREKYDEAKAAIDKLKGGDAKNELLEMAEEVLSEIEGKTSPTETPAPGGTKPETTTPPASTGENGLIDEIIAEAKSELDELNAEFEELFAIDLYSKDASTLVYSCKMKIDLGQSVSIMKETLDQSIQEESQVFDDLVSMMRLAGIKDPVVIVEYLDKDGGIITSATFK